MSTQRPVQIILELDFADDTIAGSMRHEDATPQPFTGWMELARALESIGQGTGELKQHDQGDSDAR